MNSSAEQLRTIIPYGYGHPIDRERYRLVGYEPLDVTKMPDSLLPLLRRTIRTANFGITLATRSHKIHAYLQSEVARGVGADGKFVTVFERDEYKKAEQEFETSFDALSITTLLEQRAEVLRRQTLTSVTAALWSGTSLGPEIVLAPLVHVPTALSKRFAEKNPSRLGLLVDNDDDAGLTLRVEKALVVDATDLTFPNTNSSESKEKETVKVKMHLDELADKHGLKIWGNYWNTEEISHFYQVADPKDFQSVVFKIIKAERDLSKIREQAGVK